MLRHLLEAFKPSSNPPAPGIGEILTQAGVSPAEGFPLTVSKDCIPGLTARRLVSLFSDNRHIGNMLEKGVEIYPSETRDVMLSDVEGCVASRTQLKSFKAMESDAHVNFFYEKYKADPAKIVGQVFAGSNDCISQAGDNPKIWRQPWDGKMWYVNGGGSHRAAAIRMIDRDHHFPRALLSDIEDFKFSQKLKELSSTSSILVFEAGEPSVLKANIRQLADKGIHLEPEKYSSDSWCLVISKDHSQYKEVAQAMQGCLDFAGWVNDPNGYRISSPTPSRPAYQPALA